MRIWGSRPSRALMVALEMKATSLEINFQGHILQLSSSTHRNLFYKYSHIGKKKKM